MWYTQISIFKRIFAQLSQNCTSAAIELECGGEDARMFTEAWNSRCVMCESQPKTTLHASCYSMHACDSNAEKAWLIQLSVLSWLFKVYIRTCTTLQCVHIEADKMHLLFLFALEAYVVRCHNVWVAG